MPSIPEMLADPRALAEGRQKAASLPPQHLAELCKVEKAEAEDYTRVWRENARQYWKLWLNEVEFPGKEDWQTQIWVPKVFTAAEQATALIQRSLIDTPDSFGLEGVDEGDKALAGAYWKPLLKVFMDRGKFAYKFGDASKIGFITGLAGYLKFRPTTTLVPTVSGMQPDPVTQKLMPSFATKPRSFISIDYVMPWNIRRDPDSRPRENYSGSYLWHSEWKDRPLIRSMKAWDQQVVEELLSAEASMGKTSTEYQREEDELRKQGKRHKFRKSYMIDEGWLDILDENGDVVFPNALMVHSNGKILYGPVDNPIWATDLNTGRRKWPFVATAPIIDPTKFEGRGIVEQAAPLAWLYSNVFMLWSDGLNWIVNPPTEVNQDILVDWEDLSHYPGRLWVKRGEAPALTPAQMGKMDSNDVMAALDYIDRTGQNSSFVNDNVTGLPGSRSEITKGEVQIKTAQSLAIFEAMGKNLELMGKDSVELMYDLILQFFDDFADPTIAQILGPEKAQMLGNLDVPTRVNMLQGNFDFTFSGVSQALQKADKLQKILQFATLATSPAFMGHVPPDQLLKVIGDLLGVTDRLTIYTDQDLQQQQQQKITQLLQQGVPEDQVMAMVNPQAAQMQQESQIAQQQHEAGMKQQQQKHQMDTQQQQESHQASMQQGQTLHALQLQALARKDLQSKEMHEAKLKNANKPKPKAKK